MQAEQVFGAVLGAILAAVFILGLLVVVTVLALS